MKITMVYPGITHCGFNCRRGNEGTWISHGLCLLSAQLKKEGHEVDLMDLRRFKGWHHVAKALRTNRSDVFAITMMTADVNPAIHVARLIRSLRPKARIFAGGAHPTLAPETLQDSNHFDHIFLGEGEITFPKIIAGLQEGVIVPRTVRGEIPDLENIAFADRELFDSLEEPLVDFLPAPFVTLIAGRGCRYVCNYCYPAERTIFGASVRRRSVSSVIAELEFLRGRYNFKSMMFNDDCLTEDPAWVEEFCRQYGAHGFTQPFICQSRSDLIVKNREGMIDHLKKAGLALFIIGMESGNQRVLNFLRKGAKVEHNFQAAEICKSRGIKVWANIMMGMPTETKEEVMDTFNMIRTIRPYHVSPSYFTPHPGSDLFLYCKERNLSLINSFDDYRRNTYVPKIRGVDYQLLDKVLFEMVEFGEDYQVTLTKDWRYWWWRFKLAVKAHVPAVLWNTLKRVKFILVKSLRYPRSPSPCFENGSPSPANPHPTLSREPSPYPLPRTLTLPSP